MIEWASPWAFAFLAPILLLPLQRRLTGVQRLVIPGPDHLVARWTLRRTLAQLPLILRILGLVLIVFALARPRITQRQSILESDGVDIILAVDTSGSMSAKDFSSGLQRHSRLEVAKGVLDDFIRSRPNDRIGVVVFGQEAFTHVPLTLDHQTLLDVLNTVQIGVAGEHHTAIGSAIAVSAKRLKSVDAPSRIIILLTDGQSNAGRWSPVEAAHIAHAFGIKVYTVGIGSQTGSSWLPRSRDGLDESTLRAIATTTQAKFFRATDTETLAQIYATIDELEPSPAEVEEIVYHEELFRYPLIPGTALLLLQLLLSAFWLRRSP